MEEAKHLLVALEEGRSVFFFRRYHGRRSNLLRICRIQTLTSICTALFCNLNELLLGQFCQTKKVKDHLVTLTLQAHERTNNSDAVDTHLPPCNAYTFEFWIWVSSSNDNFSCCRNYQNTIAEPCASWLWKEGYSNSFINHHFDYILVPLFFSISQTCQY